MSSVFDDEVVGGGGGGEIHIGIGCNTSISRVLVLEMSLSSITLVVCIRINIHVCRGSINEKITARTMSLPQPADQSYRYQYVVRISMILLCSR